MIVGWLHLIRIDKFPKRNNCEIKLHLKIFGLNDFFLNKFFILNHVDNIISYDRLLFNIKFNIGLENDDE